MSDARPRLEVVGGGAAGSEPAPAAEPAPTGGRPRRLLTWLLGGLLLLALAAFSLQAQRSAELAAEVEGLSQELATAQAALEAHQAHLEDVRSSVAELQALVNRDPLAPPPESP